MRLFRRHLDIAALGASLVELPDRATAAHLASCARCRRQRDRLAEQLEATRVAAHAAADAAFTPADLQRQRQSILGRIARLGPAARVLPFPAAPPVVHRHAPLTHDRRWVLAAAAAGLILGIAVGRLPGDRPATPASAPPPAVQIATIEPAPDPRRDDLLLSDVEELLSREIRPEFEALDGLTPITFEAR